MNRKTYGDLITTYLKNYNQRIGLERKGEEGKGTDWIGLERIGKERKGMVLSK